VAGQLGAGTDRSASPRAVSLNRRSAGESRGRSERGRSEVVVLVREVLRVTATSTSSVQAVHPASYADNGHNLAFLSPCNPITLSPCQVYDEGNGRVF
jgi:hypothetical protein